MNDIRPTRWQRMQQFLRATFSNRLLLAVLGVSLIPLAVLGGTMYVIASRSLITSETQKLEAIRAVKITDVTDYFQSVRDQLLTMAESRLIHASRSRISAGVSELTRRRKPAAAEAPAEAAPDEPLYQPNRVRPRAAAPAAVPRPSAATPDLATMRRKLQAYYENDFLDDVRQATARRGPRDRSPTSNL